MKLRNLGRSGIKVNPLGLGTARFSGLGWREDVIPRASLQERRDAVRQIRTAADLGVNLFDTADSYGQGFSEQILGEALREKRDGIVVVTKFGEDPAPEQQDLWALDADLVERKCEGSLRRLGFDCIDQYLLHRRDYPLELALALIDVFERLVRAGKIRFYGWSTDDVERARLFASGKHCVAIEHRMNVFNDNQEMQDLCRTENLASLNRVPLLMGVLTGRWSPETSLGAVDPRAGWFEHDNFRELLDRARQIEPYLTSEGRSVVQGALAWIWARSPLMIPLPGFRDLEQMLELVGALHFGPLSTEMMRAIAKQVKSI